MKFTLNGKPKPKKRQPIDICTKIDEDGDVMVYVVRPDGEYAVILWLRQAGEVQMGSALDARYLKSIGFTLSEDGYVLVDSL